LFLTAVGKSKERLVAYTEALTEAFASVYALKYKYNGAKVQVQTAMVQTLCYYSS
jgi:hypothetical protein